MYNGHEYLSCIKIVSSLTDLGFWLCRVKWKVICLSAKIMDTYECFRLSARYETSHDEE